MQHLESRPSHGLAVTSASAPPSHAQRALRSAVASSYAFLTRDGLESNPDLAFSATGFEQSVRRGLRCKDIDKGAMSVTLQRAYAAGEFDARDLQAAVFLRGVQKNLSLDVLRAYLEDSTQESPQAKLRPSCAAVAAEVSGQPWPQHVRERITHWARRFLSPEPGLLASPFRDRAPLQAWLAEMVIDCSDTVLGLRCAQDILRDLPDAPEHLVDQAVLRLRVPDALLESYFQSLLAEALACVPVSFRAACASAEFLKHLLAIRLAWELLLLDEFAMEGAELAWRRALQGERRRLDSDPHPAGEEEILLTIQAAYEHGEHRRHAALMLSEKDADTLDYAVGADRDLAILESLLTKALVRRSVAGLGQACPTRAATFVPAPVTAINSVIERDEGLRQLVDNGWVHLFAVYDDGAVIVRYDGNLHWAPARVQDVA